MYGIVLFQRKSRFLPDHHCKQPHCDPVPARSRRNINFHPTNNQNKQAKQPKRRDKFFKASKRRTRSDNRGTPNAKVQPLRLLRLDTYSERPTPTRARPCRGESTGPPVRPDQSKRHPVSRCRWILQAALEWEDTLSRAKMPVQMCELSLQSD
ncbi:hypothetical protein HGM15179_000657 [Zosterops borbonicus]|uniref:Uncharacterized protein n=1 Tax=Zosterops borbonicus TaxID=364589 RepID=A0A8K1H095_9PASS|nr:hypothetical protein HGM15179_000657 [Zosterops borbonicus]